TRRVSVTSAGAETATMVEEPSVSPDGRWVAFLETGDGLVAGDANGRRDVLVHDRDVDADGIFDEPGFVSTALASVATGGAQANQDSMSPSMGAGRVAFASPASTLAAGDSNGTFDVFVRDLASATTARVSLTDAGAQAAGISFEPSLSPSGRYVGFSSFAPMTPGMVGLQAYVRDRDVDADGIFDEAGASTTVCVSVDALGGSADGQSAGPALAGEGVSVVFGSLASDLLAAADANGIIDLFSRPLPGGPSARVNLRSDGGVSDAGSEGSFQARVSADGRHIAFMSAAIDLVPGDDNLWYDVFVRDRTAGTTERVTAAGGGFLSDMSPDGRFVVFHSTDAALVPGDTNNAMDVFLRDRTLGTVERVSVATGGGQAAGYSALGRVSADGRYVAFVSEASNLPAPGAVGRNILLRDRTADTTVRVSVSTGGTPATFTDSPALSADGRWIGFTTMNALVADDLNGDVDAYVHDRVSGTTVRVSVATDGSEGTSNVGSLWLSADGRFAAFATHAVLEPSDANATSDIYVRDRDTDADGVFDEPGAVATARVSVPDVGGEGNGPSWFAAFSADGRYVVFDSEADNLTAGDTNGLRDVFVRDRVAGRTARVSRTSSDGLPLSTGAGSQEPHISADGLRVVFYSGAWNLVPGDANGVADVFRAINPLRP
ncbi:MAG TPA: hypothetical protein VF950_15755, partial [Planctomycetota bacterium]